MFHESRFANHSLSLIALAGMLMLFTACPAEQQKQEQKPQAGSNADKSVPDSVSYPDDALTYLRESLASPADATHPALAYSWDAIARLDALKNDSAILAEVERGINQQGTSAPIQLIGAGVALKLPAAEKIAAEKLAAGEVALLTSLAPQPAFLDRELAGLPLNEAQAGFAMGLLLLERDWLSPYQLSEAKLMELAQHSDERVALLSVGRLIALGKASSEQRERLLAALRSDNLTTLGAAAEGAIASKDEDMAASLVPHVANSDLNPSDGYERDPQAVYAAYALSYLPGEQAALMRGKLLSAADPLLRWQARLGELLAGRPEPWLNALIAEGTEEADMWLALDAPRAVHPELLGLYRMAALSKDPEIRGRAARQLARYQGQDSPHLKEVVKDLVSDRESLVAQTAWLAAARVSPFELGAEARATLANSSADPGLRLACAYYLLSRAESAAMD